VAVLCAWVRLIDDPLPRVPTPLPVPPKPMQPPIHGPLIGIGKCISKCVGLAVGIVCMILTPSPAGPTPEDLERACEEKQNECLDYVTYLGNRGKIRKGRLARLLRDDCDKCASLCKEAARRGNEGMTGVPWPDRDDCNFLDWPEGHPNWPEWKKER